MKRTRVVYNINMITIIISVSSTLFAVTYKNHKFSQSNAVADGIVLRPFLKLQHVHYHLRSHVRIAQLLRRSRQRKTRARPSSQLPTGCCRRLHHKLYRMGGSRRCIFFFFHPPDCRLTVVLNISLFRGNLLRGSQWC